MNTAVGTEKSTDVGKPEGPLDLAIRALVNKDSTPGMRQEALRQLLLLRDHAQEHDQRLNAREASPEGHDYEALLGLLRGEGLGPSQQLREIDAASEALLTQLDHAGSLEAFQKKAYALRLAVVRALGDGERAAAAEHSLVELCEHESAAVVEAVLEMGRTHGIKQDADSVDGAVEQMARMLCLDLTDQQAASACAMVLDTQRQAARERG